MKGKMSKELMEVYRENKYLRSLQRVTRGITHNYNNIFSGVLGALETDERKRSYEGREQLTSLVNRAINETEVLYSFARYSADRKRVLSFSRVVDSAVLALRSVSPRHSVSLRCHNSIINLGGVFSDLFLMLFYLGENSIEAMSAGGAVLFEVSFEIDEFNAPWITTSVRDEGEGVDDRVAGNIFSPFFSTKNRREHYGLGLSLARETAEKHGGHLEYITDQDGGVFLLRLPAFVQAHDESTEQNQQRAAEPVKRLGKRHIFFVIDDDSTLLNYLVEGLQRRGHIVFSASTCKEAQEEFEHVSNIVTIVLVDIGLADGDGVECMRGLLASYDVKRVIFMSGEDHKGRTAGISGSVFIRKPFTIRQLEELAENVKVLR